MTNFVWYALLGLSPDLFKAIMKRGYKVPTPIQRKVSGERRAFHS